MPYAAGSSIVREKIDKFYWIQLHYHDKHDTAGRVKPAVRIYYKSSVYTGRGCCQSCAYNRPRIYLYWTAPSFHWVLLSFWHIFLSTLCSRLNTSGDFVRILRSTSLGSRRRLRKCSFKRTGCKGTRGVACQTLLKPTTGKHGISHSSANIFCKTT